jgi:uncharacterized protein (DUF2147 family)
MSYCRSILATLLLLLPITFLTARAATPDPTGIWLDEGGQAAIRIAPCGGAICGSLYWMKDPNDDNGKPSRDSENPNPALRQTPLCGLTILKNFRRDEPGEWTDGTVYNPESGHSFDAELKLKSANVLRLRGYVLTPLLGGNERFTRVTTTLPACSVR